MTNTKAHEDFSCSVDLNMEKLNDSTSDNQSTNDLDLETMDLLTEMLSNYNGTLLIVSS